MARLLIGWDDTGRAPAAVIADLVGGASIELGQVCPRCAGSDHGRPWLRVAGTDAVVSWSRSSGRLLVALTRDPGLYFGIDVEMIDKVAALDAASYLAAGESAADPVEAAWLWTAKEAITKARGIPLTQPSAVTLDRFDGSLIRIEAPPGFVAAVALLSRPGAQGAARAGSTDRARYRASGPR